MNEALLRALAQADEAYLTGLSNKGIYKRAVKDAADAEGSVAWQDGAAVVSISGETCTLRDPLWDSTCSCPSRSMCRHVVAAMLWLRDHSEIPEEALEPEPEEEIPAPVEETAPVIVKSIPAADAVRECAAQTTALLADVLRWGLVRLPESMAEHIEAAAVRCHALGMADAERMVRELGTQLENSRERRAVFRAEDFLLRLCRAVQTLDKLRTADPLTEEMLGTFRQSYASHPGDLEILPIGQRQAYGGDYEGMYYYFLDMKEKRFLTYANIRPVFYEGTGRRPIATAMWNTGLPMRALMQSRMVLTGAKLSGDKLSASQETNVVMRTKANPDCEEVRELIVQDFRTIPILLPQRRPQWETQRMFFLHPVSCPASRFDAHSQQLIVTLEDAFGARADIRVRYRTETKKLIEEVEALVKRMQEHPEKDYVWLCTANFEEGQLVLYPIEFYDFIRCPAPERAELPRQFGYRENAYAPDVLALLREVESLLTAILQSGLQSVLVGEEKLAARAARCGMHGLSDLLTVLGQTAGSYRHSMQSDPVPALHAVIRLERYLMTGREKLDALCAVAAMTQRETGYQAQ